MPRHGGRGTDCDSRLQDVPTLFRFLFIIGVIVGAVYAGMWALATFVEPQERDITVTIPNARLGK
jgi:hypothetical protein